MNRWGEKRGYTPGIVYRGRLITTDLKEIHLGVRQYVKHSYYDEWEKEITEDPEGNPIAKEHPWNKETKPKPQPRDWNGRYSWGIAPRWFDRRNNESYVVEAGPIARMYASALAGKVHIESPWAEVKTGNGVVRISLPESRSELLKPSLFDAMEFEWKIPKITMVDGTPAVNALERNKARAYCHAYYAAAAFKAMHEIISYLGKGQTEMWRPHNKPSESLGVGLNEAGRGALGHWLVVRDGKIHRYQIITPTAWNISPKDDRDRPGPVEEAMKGVPITEENEPDDWVGVDILRVVRSYDPCLACTVHVFKGRSLIRKVEVTSLSSFPNISGPSSNKT
jgi:hydrogenase large subunit